MTTGIFLLLVWACRGSQIAVACSLGALAVAATILCGFLGAGAEQAFGKKDPSQVVLDEIAGQSATYLFLPLSVQYAGCPMGVWMTAGVGFLAFRLFDIFKPPPARLAEKLPGGWGIVTDDLVAAVWANLSCQAILRLAPKLL